MELSLTQWLILGFTIAALLGAGLVAGWSWAVHRFKTRHVQMADEFDRMANIVGKEPTRAGIDIGKRYTTERVRRTLDDIDSETQ